MQEKQKAILVSIAKTQSDVPETEKSLDELERLLDTAGGETVARVIQVKESFDPRTCIGAGKVQEINELVRHSGADTVVFDFELSPSQIRNLEDTFENCIPLCFDCHADMGKADPKHPKGKHYSESELIQHRDSWYKKIEKTYRW